MRMKMVKDLFILLGLSCNLYAAEIVQTPKLKATLDVLVFGDIDFSRKTVNLTPYEYNDTLDKTPTLTLDNYSDGFMLSHGLNFDLGVGPGVSLYFDNIPGLGGNLSQYLGLALVAEKSVEFTSLVDHKEDIKRVLKEKRIPWKGQQILTWREGESVFYQTTGGIAISARFGAFYTGVGPTLIVAGGWQTYIEKMDNGNVFVQLMRAKIADTRLVAGTLLAEVSASVIKELSKGISFAFDLNNDDAAHGYEEMLKGNIVPAQLLAADSEQNSVVSVERTLHLKKRHVRRFSVGIPFLYFTTSKEKYSDYVKKDSFLDGSTREVYAGGIVKGSTGRAITLHRYTREGFYSALELHSNIDKKDNLDYLGRYNWSYSTDHGSSKKLGRALRRLIKKTGLLNDLAVNVPKANKLKYTSVAFDLNFPQTFVDYLLLGNQGMS